MIGIGNEIECWSAHFRYSSLCSQGRVTEVRHSRKIVPGGAGTVTGA